MKALQSAIRQDNLIKKLSKARKQYDRVQDHPNERVGYRSYDELCTIEDAVQREKSATIPFAMEKLRICVRRASLPFDISKELADIAADMARLVGRVATA
jgi:hypothetical protein